MCDAATAIIVGVAIQDSLLRSLAEALVKGEDDFMEDDCSKDRGEGQPWLTPLSMRREYREPSSQRKWTVPALP